MSERTSRSYESSSRQFLIYTNNILRIPGFLPKHTLDDHRNDLRWQPYFQIQAVFHGLHIMCVISYFHLLMIILIGTE